jgi:hypothetical protein
VARGAWKELPVPDEVVRLLPKGGVEPPREFVHPEGLIALRTRDEIEPDDWRWHISLRHKERVPTWDELARAGHELRPGVCFCIGVPPRSWWMNLHENVLHLYELKDEALMAQWRAESQHGATPPTKGGRRRATQRG